MNEQAFLQLKWNKFVSVSHPYKYDDFVHSNSVVIKPDLFDPLEYYSFLQGGLLECLCKSISKRNSSNFIEIIDAGVYMGAFSIAISLICKESKIDYSIRAIEGLPNLIAPVLENFKMYG